MARPSRSIRSMQRTSWDLHHVARHAAAASLPSRAADASIQHRRHSPRLTRTAPPANRDAQRGHSRPPSRSSRTSQAATRLAVPAVAGFPDGACGHVGRPAWPHVHPNFLFFSPFLKKFHKYTPGCKISKSRPLARRHRCWR